MARIIWTEPALQELDEIADYISLDNPNAAKGLVREAFKRVDHLVRHPKSGKHVEEFEVSVYREIVLPPCRIFYRIADDIVYIIHVIREEQFLHIDILKSR
ncbi:type II toxin-antitoxin system RelE/ParE family toxin [Rhodohalobacter sp. 8-1]|uniref:type II toxin-antitoxin system RelE/ParE family toxin n=1 Tax=Rhodohalobacter sp. 8-1 TaxID=3131972 RepID=UPI0030EE65F6